MLNLPLLKGSKSMYWFLGTDTDDALLQAFAVDALRGFLHRVIHLFVGLQEKLLEIIGHVNKCCNGRSNIRLRDKRLCSEEQGLEEGRNVLI